MRGAAHRERVREIRRHAGAFAEHDPEQDAALGLRHEHAERTRKVHAQSVQGYELREIDARHGTEHEAQRDTDRGRAGAGPERSARTIGARERERRTRDRADSAEHEREWWRSTCCQRDARRDERGGQERRDQKDAHGGALAGGDEVADVRKHAGGHEPAGL